MKIILNIETDIKNENDWIRFKNQLNKQVLEAAFSIRLSAPQLVAHTNLDFFGSAWQLMKLTQLPFDQRAKEFRECIEMNLDKFVEKVEKIENK